MSITKLKESDLNLIPVKWRKLIQNTINLLIGDGNAGQSGTPQWVKYRLTYEDFSAAATTLDFNLFNLAPRQYISDVKIFTIQDFSGGAISDYTITVGVVGLLNKWGSAQVFTGNTSAATTHSPTAGMESATVSTDIRVAAESVDANLNAATQGIVEIHLLMSTLPSL